MRVLVTGSSGHLGEALMRVLATRGHEGVGLDVQPGPFTTRVGSISDPACVADAFTGIEAVLHTATLHKPHVASHAKRDFVDTNITGTLTLLEQCVASGVDTLVFTSTTSTFGAALSPPPSAPAAWIDETVRPVPKNIYGSTKTAAEDLCHLFHRRHALCCPVLRTSRFFPEEDDRAATRAAFADENSKANEFLFRRVDLEDVVEAHLLALKQARDIGFGRFVISATTPFTRTDLRALRRDAAMVVKRRVPGFEAVYRARGYRMAPSIDRVYANGLARARLGWAPRWDFARVLGQLANGEPIGSQLAREVGSKGYHPERFAVGPYPVE